MEPSGEKEIAEFDPSGKMTSHKLLYPDGNTKNYTEATYDKKGNLTDEHTWNYEHGFKETLRRFKHDRNGNISVSAQYDNGKLTEQYMYKYKGGLLVGKFRYDERGQLVGKEITQYTKTGKPSKKYREYAPMGTRLIFTCEYDKADNLTDSSTYASGNQPINKTTKTYDQEGRIIREETSLWNGRTIKRTSHTYGKESQQTEISGQTGIVYERHTYTFDEKHNIITHRTQYSNHNIPFDGQTVTLSPEGDTLTIAYEAHGETEETETRQYDGDKHLIQRTITNNKGETLRTIKQLYDERGNLTTTTEYDGTGNVRKQQEYTFDQHNNLTESKTFTNGELTHKAIYKIEY